ncbi:unnamed protein product [Enterobius vermicularis]|uniref:PlsC domain-containing protein n=1 Tax=Enterobius vermicularis TaxID=51028 RepID=A0A0N4V4C9_ENTVE|nr:unnamed protein product [Enterobius vermicularis]
MGEPERVRVSGTTEKIRGIVASSIIFLSAFFGSFYILLPLLPLMFINHTLWRKVIDRLVGFWLILPSGILEFIYGIKFTVTGQRLENNEPALIIMNHRTRLDWLFFWNALLRIDPWLLTSQKISLKKLLKYIPGAGWAMSCDMFIFLSRSFEDDCSRIESLIKYYQNSGYNYQVLLFPEGTDKCERATERSRLYALRKGLKHYAHVLHPKTTGFAFIVSKMREVNYIRNVYDVTIAYPDTIVQTELDFIRLGACPRNVHFDIRKIDIGSLPASRTDLSSWLIDLWKSKEERLEKFYSEQDPEKRRLDTEYDAQSFVITKGHRKVQVCVVTFWLFLTGVWTFVFWTYPSQLLLVTLGSIIFIGSQVLYDGIEWLAVRVAGGRIALIERDRSYTERSSDFAERNNGSFSKIK